MYRSMSCAAQQNCSWNKDHSPQRCAGEENKPSVIMCSMDSSVFFLLPTRWYSGQWHSYCLQYSDLLFRFYLLRDPESGLNRTSSCVLFFSRRELSHVTATVRASGECRDRQNSGSFWGWCSCCSKQKQVSDSKGSSLVIAVKLFLPCMSFLGEAFWFNFKKVQSLKALRFFIHNLISKFWLFFFWKAIHIC